jgi:hypothetical protein
MGYACQVIKADDRPCRNYARKGMTCCYPHRKLETEAFVPEIQDILYNELVESMKFVDQNEIEWKLQERRVSVFKVIDTHLPKEKDWHSTMKTIIQVLNEDDTLYRNGFVCVNPL